MTRKNHRLSGVICGLLLTIVSCDGESGDEATGGAATGGTTTGTGVTGTSTTGTGDCGWWCDDSGSTDTGEAGGTKGGDTKGGDTKGGDTKGGDDKGGDDFVYDVWYTKGIDRNTGTGKIGYYRSGHAELGDCMVSYTYEPAPASDCPSCMFAWNLTLLAAEVENASGCAGEEARAGEVVGYGHGNDGQLWINVGEGWSAIADPKAESSLQGSSWNFSHPPL